MAVYMKKVSFLAYIINNYARELMAVYLKKILFLDYIIMHVY